MPNSLYRPRQFFQFYRAAVTKYQLHSPFAFEWASAVLEDTRRFYAFRDIEALRAKMRAVPTVLDIQDLGTGQPGPRREKLGDIVVRSASSPAQGRQLFRLVDWLKPAALLELGTSTGIGAMYLASAAGPQARLLTLEGSPALANVARTNFNLLKLTNAEVLEGPFADTLPAALERLGRPDLVFFDGHHRAQPTLQYFEACLARAHDHTVFVFDDVYWSPEMTAAWRQIQQHPRVTLTLDSFDLAFAFIQPDFREKQHFRVTPVRWKPWKVF